MRNDRDTFPTNWKKLWIVPLLLLGLWAGCAGESAGQDDSIPKSAHLQSARQLRAADVLVPESLAQIGARFDGEPKLPLIFVIGEDHVDLEVQTEVADLLGFLHSAFGVSLIGAEGFDEPLPIVDFDSWVAQRAAARAELLDRRIGGLEYAALVYPGLRVIGVSDVKAYEDHGTALEAVGEKSERLVKDLQEFITNDVARLRVSSGDAQRLSTALEKMLAKNDWSIFDQALAEILSHDSPVRRKMKRLVERQEALQQESEALVSAESPHMQRRDLGLVVRTLETMRNDPTAAMVVGKFHLPGVERELRQRGVAYVTLLPISHEQEESNQEQAADYALYEDLIAEKKTRFEKWLSERRPKSTLFREFYPKRLAIMAALINAEYMLIEGKSPALIRQFTANAQLPPGFEIRDLYDVEGKGSTSLSGHAIEFVYQGKEAHAYFTNKKLGIDPADEKVLEEGTLDDLHYVILDGAGGGVPPTINRRPRAASDDADPPGGPGGRRYRAAVEKQEQEYPEAVSIAYMADSNGRLFRSVGLHPFHYLGISIEELRKRQERLESSTEAEKADAARELAEILFVQLEENLPEGRSVLYQVSENDVLGSLSLPWIAAIGGHPSAGQLEAFTENHSIPWDRLTRTDLPPEQDPVNLMSQPSPRASFENTVVLLSDELKESPELAAVLEQIQTTNVRINQMPSERDSLILVGIGETDAGVTFDSPESSLRQALQQAEAVVAVNWSLEEALASEARSLQQIQVDRTQGPTMAHRFLERLDQKSGEESLAQVVRESANRDSTELSRVFSNRSQLEDVLLQAKISVARDAAVKREGV